VIIRAVVDTNIVISGVLTPGGTPAEVLRGAGVAFRLVWTPGIVAECLRVLTYEKVARRLRAVRGEEAARALVGRLADGADLVAPELLPQLRAVKDDPSDDLFLATALAGGAPIVVSGDRRHLLSMREFAGVRIIDAATFAEELGLGGGGRRPGRPGSVHEPADKGAAEQPRRFARKALLESMESRGESDLTDDEAMKLALEGQRWARAQARRARRGR
jgi:putative PIN family toxin of toxin-antitoxin system